MATGSALRRAPGAVLLLVALALVAALVAARPAAAQDDPARASAAQELADRYAPIVVVKDQEEACDKDGEAYRPVPVKTVLGKPEIRLLDGDGQVIMNGPEVADIAGLGPETSLDFPGNPRRPKCQFEQDFQRFGADEPDVAYAHIATEALVPGRLALQYWFFWYFDDYVNTHEGDWEFIQLVFNASTPEEALGEQPVEVGYSQHSGGERAAWDDPKLEKEGDRPLVYAAAGSHANFYSSNLYLGRSADEGFGCDSTEGPSTRLPTEARLLSSNPSPDDPDAWLLFEGRWGEFQPAPYDAPPGPRTKDEWTEPMSWQDSLRESSFAVPNAATLGPTATGAFCSTVALGGRIYTFVSNPWVLMLIVLGVVSTGGLAVRSTAWSPRIPRPLRRVRTSGQVLRAAWGAYRSHLRTMLTMGVVFLPAAAVEIAAQHVVVQYTPAGDLVSVAGNDSLVSVAFALLVAGAGHVLATSLVVGGVAAALDAADAGRPHGPLRALRLMLRRALALLGTIGLATLAVFGLAFTIIGIPWAIERLGRWAVCLPACAIEGLRPRDALRRSADLTRGHWWRSARVSLLVNGVAAVSGPIVGIALLFLTSLPLGAVNGVSSAVYVATMPFAGAALAMLWGDLIARRRGGPQA
ncbi:MAG: hypothetical protein AB7V62_06545 [Thermoleophilia bacterium]